MGIEDGYQKPRRVDALVRALIADGFTEDESLTAARQEWCDHPETGGGDMSERHPYRVLHTLVKGDVEVVIEQNTSEDRDLDAIVTYRPVAFVTRTGQDYEVEERFSSHHAEDIEAVLEHADMLAEGVGSRLPHETKYQRVTDAHQPQFS